MVLWAFAGRSWRKKRGVREVVEKGLKVVFNVVRYVVRILRERYRLGRFRSGQRGDGSEQVTKLVLLYDPVRPAYSVGVVMSRG